MSPRRYNQKRPHSALGYLTRRPSHEPSPQRTIGCATRTSYADRPLLPRRSRANLNPRLWLWTLQICKAESDRWILTGAAGSGSDLCRYLRRRPSASLSSVAANDIIEFGSNRRAAFAAVVKQQPAFAFVPREAEYNSGDAAAQEAQYEGAEKAHGVHPSGVVKQSSPDTHTRTDIGVRLARTALYPA
jgi:hypothetical protein